MEKFDVSYFDDYYYPENIEEAWAKFPPLITRRLTQPEIHGLVSGLSSVLNRDNILTVYIHRPFEIVNISKIEEGWRVGSETGVIEAGIFHKLQEITDMLALAHITSVEFSPDGQNQITIYDVRYPFVYGPEQENVNKNYLPGLEFEYPKEKITEEAYFKQLEQENQELRGVLTGILGKDLANLTVGYQKQPDVIKAKNYLESKLAQGNLIGQYLG